jgi:hypothetical protein
MSAFGTFATCRRVRYASAGQAQTPAQTPNPAQIDRNGVLILIRSSLLALDPANTTGNYTVLRDIGAPGGRRGTDAIDP